MFGKLPAYGFFIRHAENLSVRDIFLSFGQDDARPVIVCDDVQELDIINVKAKTSPATSAYIYLRNVNDARIIDNKPLGPTGTFIKLIGENADLHLSGNDFSQVKDKKLPGPHSGIIK